MAELKCNPYEVLGVPLYSDQQVIRAAYKRLILLTHPDKIESKQNVVDTPYLDVQSAYDLLNDAVRKSELDRSLLKQRYPYQEVLSLSDMDIMNRAIYSTECRCGGEYIIESEEIGLIDQNISTVEVPCSNCSLAIVIHIHS